MSGKDWSNLFILMAAINFAMGLIQSNPLKGINWLAIPCFLILGVITRRMA
ncbi:MAG TPA: hypothetical protein VN517_13230 [Terriglobales bacterium]|nr:hypothetical protein [Terriglobales bacterium]